MSSPQQQGIVKPALSSTSDNSPTDPLSFQTAPTTERSLNPLHPRFSPITCDKKIFDSTIDLTCSTASTWYPLETVTAVTASVTFDAESNPLLDIPYEAPWDESSVLPHDPPPYSSTIFGGRRSPTHVLNSKSYLPGESEVLDRTSLGPRNVSAPRAPTDSFRPEVHATAHDMPGTAHDAINLSTGSSTTSHLFSSESTALADEGYHASSHARWPAAVGSGIRRSRAVTLHTCSMPASGSMGYRFAARRPTRVPPLTAATVAVTHPHLFENVPFSCYPCRCGKSNCLRLYCSCFRTGVLCNPDLCKCVDCLNVTGEVSDARAQRIAFIVNSNQKAFRSNLA